MVLRLGVVCTVGHVYGYHVARDVVPSCTICDRILFSHHVLSDMI